MSATETLLDARGVVVEHRQATLFRRDIVRAVDGIDLRVHAGDRIAIVGPSGCGKTSLLRALCGLYPRTAGSVDMLGLDPAHRRRPPPGVQLLFQDAGAALHPLLTVAQTLRESARVHRPSEGRAVAEILESLGIADRAEALPAQLSGGEKRRVTLAMMLLARPRLVLADEPTAGLDAARKAEVLDLLLSQQSANTALVLVTHDLLVARHACDRIVFLDSGRVIDDIRADALHTARDPTARRLLRASRLVDELSETGSAPWESA